MSIYICYYCYHKTQSVEACDGFYKLSSVKKHIKTCANKNAANIRWNISSLKSQIQTINY